MKCPWCKGPLESYHSGIKCPKCLNYYERDGWWSVACDDAHAHTTKCLIEQKPPQSKKRKKVKVKK